MELFLESASGTSALLPQTALYCKQSIHFLRFKLKKGIEGFDNYLFIFLIFYNINLCIYLITIG